LEGARAVCGPRHPPPPFLQAPLPSLEAATVPLSSLVRFLEHPVRAFLRDRVGLYAGEVPEQLAGSLPVEMSPLERWALGDRLLQACLAGKPAERALDAERGRGLLPPGPLGGTALAEVMRVVAALIQEAGRWPCWEMPALPIEVKVALPDGTAVVGTVPGVRGGTILRCVYSKLAAKHRLRAWAQFLALSAAHPELGASTLTIGQSEGSSASRPRVSVATLGPLGADGGGPGTAARQLSALVDLYRRGMREPLPLYCATSAAWAAAPGALQDPVEAARRQWASGFEDLPGESSEAEHVAVLGEDKAFLELCEEAPRADESGPGWDMSEATRLGRLAKRLWSPLLQHEKRQER